MSWLEEGDTHDWIVSASAGDDRLAIARANYLLARQNSLDLNQAPELLRYWQEKCRETARELLSRL